MPVLITGDELKEAVEKETFIRDGSTGCAEGVKYDFSLSYRILKAKFGQPIDVDKLPEAQKKELFIEPGEAVFVLSLERLVLPRNMTAQLSPKRKLSHEGILSVGGLYIDPGYQGRILLGLLNISSTPWPLQPGRKLIGATFFRLEDSEASLESDFQPPVPLDDFPDDLVRMIRDYKPVALTGVLDNLRTLEGTVSQLQMQITSHQEWKNRIERYLEESAQSLRDEIEVRRIGQDKLTIAVSNIEKTLAVMKWFAGVVTTVATALLISWLVKTFFGG